VPAGVSEAGRRMALRYAIEGVLSGDHRRGHVVWLHGGAIIHGAAKACNPRHHSTPSIGCARNNATSRCVAADRYPFYRYITTILRIMVVSFSGTSFRP